MNWRQLLFCRILPWHNGDGETDKHFDGCSFHATCSRCKQPVMLDSQGNWFTYETVQTAASKEK